MSVLAAWAAPLIDEMKKARPGTKSENVMVAPCRLSLSQGV
jgi:hypothetical protein